MKNAIVLVIGAVWCMLAASQDLAAQETAPEAAFQPTTIVSEGVFAFEAVPDYVEFTLSWSASAKTYSEALTQALAARDTVRDTLAQENAAPDVVFREPTLEPQGKDDRSTVSFQARVRFGMIGLREGDDFTRFAELCDRTRMLATTLGCKIAGPTLGVLNPTAAEQSAVSRAIEKAYSPAEGAALIMSGRIHTVQSVEIIKVSWNTGGDTPPTPSRICCTARVKVTYLFTSDL